MFLKALEIQGFKSFPDRTRVTFGKGITAVVGPNGSGKSNISDAIRWVMGETSIKQLRGGGKMENVIFGGTSKRNAMGYVSVQLVLDNVDRRLDIDADEVSIGRKYYRSGESEYSVNGQSVRLKDVYELLLDTGLGRDGYSVIGQGRIAEIVGAKSSERREIFEEASGIARFRYRKNESERRLAAAEENLLRLRDILGELEARVGPLEKESEKAKRFLKLSQEKKSLEVTLWVSTVRETRDTLRSQQRKIDLAEADYATKRREIDALDAETQGIRTEIEQITIGIERANASIRALQEEISGQDSKIAVLQNNIAHNKSSMAALQEEVSQSGEFAGEIETEIALHSRAISAAQQVLQTTKDRITVLEGRLTDIQTQSLATGERRGKVQARLAQMTDNITSLRVGEASAKSTASEAQTRYSTDKENLLQAEKDFSDIEMQKTDTDAMLKTVLANLVKLENIKGGLEIKLATHNKAFEDAEEDSRALTRRAEAAKQRISMLQELERSLDGFGASVKSVVNAARASKLRGIIGPVSTILTVKPGYEVAIETALGYSLQNLVVEDEASAKAAMAFLKQTNGGRATFLPMDTVKAQHMDTARLPDGAISAQKLVGYNQQYENIVSSLLARIVVVEDINEAGHTARTLNYRNRIVTRDGQVINAGGSFTGGSVSRSAGLFSRKQEIEDLRVKLLEFAAQRDSATAKTSIIKTEVDKLSASLTATSSEAITAGGDKIRCNTELERIMQALGVAQQNKERMAASCEELRQTITQANNQTMQSKNEQQSLTSEIESLSAELTEIAGSDDDFLSTRETFSNELSDLKLAALGYERDTDLHRQNIETLKSRTGEGEARRALLVASIEKLQAENLGHDAEISATGSNASTAKEKIAEAETQINSFIQTRLQKEGSITGQTTRERAITAQREDLSREIARLTEQKSTLEARYDGTISQLWDEYELTLTDAEALCVEFSSGADLRRRVHELRGKIRSLGNVNVSAIEEFAEVNERYTFLRAQVHDVEESKTSLEKLIAELSAEMTVIFSKSFEEINRQFARVFTELFGGGKGELSLSNPDDLLESGIEIAVAPPGKIIKDLAALSGGEQALVAICIYFAILAVNPAPFCVLDEIEAALDDVNVVRYAQYLRRIAGRTQFIVITHRRGTMEEADVLYGVTMQENGISKILRLNVAEVDASLVR